MSTIYYTSSFDKVKDLIEMGYEDFISIAGNTPDWFSEKIGKDKRFKKLSCIAPKYSWWKNWKDRKLTNEDYEKLYKETVLDKLDYKELKTSLGCNSVFLCYEDSKAGAKKEFEELKTTSIYDIKKFLKWFDPDTHHTFEIIPEHEFKYILKEDGKFSTAFKLIKVELKD